MGALNDSWTVAFVFGLLPGSIVGFGLALAAGIMDKYVLFQAAVGSIFVVAIIWATVAVLLPDRKKA